MRGYDGHHRFGLNGPWPRHFHDNIHPCGRFLGGPAPQHSQNSGPIFRTIGFYKIVTHDVNFNAAYSALEQYENDKQYRQYTDKSNKIGSRPKIQNNCPSCPKPSRLLSTSTVTDLVLRRRLR